MESPPEVAFFTLDGTWLVLGATDQNVTLLTEVHPEPTPATDPAARPAARPSLTPVAVEGSAA